MKLVSSNHPKHFFLFLIFLCCNYHLYSQKYSGNINLYGFKYEETKLYPSLTATLNYETKKANIFSEIRLNYEDLNLYSALLGLNYILDKDSNITITPYSGFTFGTFNSIPAGFVFYAESQKFDFYSQQQVNNRISNSDTGFYFSWSEINLKYLRKTNYNCFVGLTNVIDASNNYSDIYFGIKSGFNFFEKIETSFYLFKIREPSYYISLLYEF
ncbi:MAG: hypothetical protein IT243_07525 [Bacteroidia bacterium]|nr:hypothetical protein [Bacteroidia bacterium]